MARQDRERWDRRYEEGSYPLEAEPVWLSEFAAEIPDAGRALDVAAGRGSVAIWLAVRGFDVTAVDASPVGLEFCQAAAEKRGVRVRTVILDLEHEELPIGPYAVITCFHYLQRDLFPRMAERLAPDGVIVCELATKQNLERHARPPANFLLEPGEILELCAGLDVIHHHENWIEDRAQARIIARRRV